MAEFTPVIEQEGGINVAYDLQPPAAVIAESGLMASLNAWRSIFRRLGLAGLDPQRYGGFSFGNLSARDSQQPKKFVITASQTGALTSLQDEHFVRITGFNLNRFWVDAMGSQPPSSETLTHAMVYTADPRITWVFHCHSPEIWSKAQALAVPCTDPDVAYGTPEMVTAVAQVLETHQSRPLLFATLGHQDGVFTCGPTARDTGGLMVSYLARALA